MEVLQGKFGHILDFGFQLTNGDHRRAQHLLIKEAQMRLVSFLFGAFVFHERNLTAKAFDLLLVLLGMIFLYIGSH